MSKETRAIYVFQEASYILLENVEASLRHAADRWGATLRIVKRTDPRNWFWKDKALHALQAEEDRVLWLDGDILVNISTPNPFEIVPADRLGMVSIVQDHRIPLPEQPIHHGVPMPNGGFQLSGRKHREPGGFYDRLRKIWEPIRFQGYDQNDLQKALAEEGLHAVVWLPSAFNFLLVPKDYRGPGSWITRESAVAAWKAFPRMPAWMVHAKTTHPDWKWKKWILEHLDWEIPLPGIYHRSLKT